MLPQLPEIAFPAWLANLSPEAMIDAPFPLERVLQNSLYYPSSAFDGDPVRHLAGNILSFVYADYGYSRQQFMNALQKPGFRGYEQIGTRSVTEGELVPRGWRPTPPTDFDGDPFRYRSWIKPPFCSWSLFQRRKDFPASHGPIRFSLLYLCADGVAAFQALYVANNEAPKALAIIQPGHGFGANYTDYENPEKILARSVLGNQAGRPDILLFGGYGCLSYYRTPCWPTYRDQLCFIDKAGGGGIGVWKNANQQGQRTYSERSARLFRTGRVRQPIVDIRPYVRSFV